MITSGSDLGEGFEGPFGPLVLGALRVHVAQDPAVPVEALERGRLLTIQVEPASDRDLLVVGPPDETATVVVADRVVAGGRGLHVVGTLAARAQPAVREPSD